MTYPLLKLYAKKIGATFHQITERKFPGWPIVYEKLQIKELAKDQDFVCYYDSDALIHPETPDWSDHLPPHTVAHNGLDWAGVRWAYDDYFRRDGRNIGSCNWCTWAPHSCLDLWTPLDIPFEEARLNIYPTVGELVPAKAEAKQCEKCKLTFTQPQMVVDENGEAVLNPQVVDRDHLIDDYTLSRNIARYGLKCTSLIDLQEKIGLKGADLAWHDYEHSIDVKAQDMRAVVKKWRVEKYIERLK
jgi:hypothetical protein